LQYTLSGYIFYPVEFGKLTADFLIKFKIWLSRQDASQAEIARRLEISRQALTDQLALRKRRNTETLLRMQAMMRKRFPLKKRTIAAFPSEEAAGNRSTVESDPFVPGELRRSMDTLFMI